MDPVSLSAFAAALAVVVGVLALSVVWRKGRPFAQGDVFRASRLSRGNHLLPTQVLVSPTSVVHYTPQWFGKYEHSIHVAHVASVGIDTHIIFSDVLIETTGGASPIHCRGHYRSDAVRMKQLIEQYQTAYFKGAHPS
jgi:hypothetical protein